MTAVEFIADELYRKFEMKGSGLLFNFIFNKAKKMETDFIIKFFDWANENAYKYPTKTTTLELLEIYKKQL